MTFRFFKKKCYGYICPGFGLKFPKILDPSVKLFRSEKNRKNNFDQSLLKCGQNILNFPKIRKFPALPVDLCLRKLCALYLSWKNN